MTQICKEKMNEGTDIKRVFLLFVRKLWIIVLVTLVGLVIGASIYSLYYKVVDGTPTYMKSNDYYIDFNHTEYPDGMDYYNAYTWGQFIKDDKIMGYVMEELPSDIDRQEVMDSVSSVMVSDYRVLTVQIKGKDKDRVEKISEAYEGAMPRFAEDVKELSAISLWSSDEITVINEHNKTGNAAFLGGLIALILSLFVFAAYYALDDRIYTEADFNRYFTDIAFLGYDSDGYRKDYEANYKAIVKGAEVVKCSNVSDELENISKTGRCVLEIEWGKTCATKIRYDIDLLKKQSCELIGVSMKNCNEKFLKVYYGRRK